MKTAVLIAVEQSADKALPTKEFAEADVRALAAVLARQGFLNPVLLVGGDATKTILESRLRKTFKSLAPDDILLIYYAGQAFSAGEENFLTCADSQRDDLEETSVSLTRLLKQIRDSACRNHLFFLDADRCTTDGSEGYDDWSDGELQTFFSSAGRGVGFSSRRSGERSWSSRDLKHGIWAGHVIEAFDGRAPAALDRDSLLTAAALQDHLLRCVPQTLTATFAEKKSQTPTIYGAGAADVVLADLGAMLADRKPPLAAQFSEFGRLTLLSRRGNDVRRMAAFNKKTHHVPDADNEWGRAFVADLAAAEIKAELDATFARLKKVFGFKRNQIHVSEPGDGTGTVVTPYFNYSVSVSLNHDNPAEVLWLRIIDAIKEPAQLLSDAFETVFEKTFDALEFNAPTAIDLGELIDRIEDRADDALAVEYDRELTYCRLRMKGVSAAIQVNPRSLSLAHNKPISPKGLLQLFFELQRALVETHDIRLLGM